MHHLLVVVRSDRKSSLKRFSLKQTQLRSRLALHRRCFRRMVRFVFWAAVRVKIRVAMLVADPQAAHILNGALPAIALRCGVVPAKVALLSWVGSDQFTHNSLLLFDQLQLMRGENVINVCLGQG